MSLESPINCQLCHKVFSTKYNLNKHLKCIHRQVLSENMMEDAIVLACESERCSFTTVYKSELFRHSEKCSFLIIDRQMGEIKSEYEKMLVEKQTEIDRLKSELQQTHIDHVKAVSQVERELIYAKGQLDAIQKENDHARQMLSHAMDKPTIIQNNNNSQNFHVTNMLASHDVYTQQMDYNHIVEMARKFFEPYFWDGQRGAARFAVEHIIIIGDSWILCCSDPTRNRFRFRNRDNKLQDDIKAKLFIEKLSKPLKYVCHDLFQAIRNDLQEKMKMVTNVWEKGDLELKIGMAENRYFLICDMDDDGKNAEFRSELASRLRGPESEIENKSEDNMST